MTGEPDISVVMAVYNSAGVVAEAIESILHQTFGNFEFIIIDDGSTDSSGEILREYKRRDSRIEVYTQSNQGLIASLNRGCRMAKGRYIARMDADDISLPSRFEKQFGFMEAHPEIGVLGTWIQDVDERRQPIIEWPVPSDPVVVRWFLFFGNCIAHPSVMLRRDLLERMGYYRPDALHVEDYDLWIRAAEVTALANLPEVLVQYRVSAGSVSGRNDQVQRERTAALAKKGKIVELYEAYLRKARPDRKQKA
jgi:glycosyltransferase involved in cell wall biosynthesis